ncbi:MAG TPA: GNAT family N-acetyltransferase [Candidatus Limnocylindria bacterium]|jgi:GNAT superfamily N-acetyltransferase
MTDTIQVRVNLRPLDLTKDIAVLTAITNAAVTADRVQERLTEQQFALEVGPEEKFDPDADFRVAEVDGVPVAFCKVEFIDTNDGFREYRSWCEVHPEWRRRRVGSTLFAWARQRIDELSAGHDVDRPRVAGCWGSVTDLGADPLFRAHGYEPARWFFHMNRDLSQPIAVPPLPEGIEIRPVTADDARRLFLADNEAFLDHWGGIDTSEAAFQKWIADDDWDPSLHVVAFDGDEIAGAVINAIYHKANADMGVLHGWLDSVFTRRPWRRRGLAHALVARSLVLLKERGMAEGILGVDADNETGALGVYTDNGFVVTEKFTAYRRPLEVGG